MKQQMMNTRPRTAWVAMFVFAGACNSVLGTDALRADGCPSVGTLDCEDVVTPKICRADGQWELLAPCVDQACEAGQCVGNCAPSFRQCEDNTPEVCNKTGQWIREVKCQGKTCLDGICLRCNGNILESCVSIFDYWIEAQNCSQIQKTCWQGTCAGVCVKGNARCQVDAKTPEICNEQGQWQAQPPCAGACVAGACP